jgi:hypothetical protein
MATFTVDPATLAKLSSTLSGVHSEMQSMHGVATGFEGRLGGSDLDSVLEGFCSHWGYGISVLAQHMGSVIESLNHAAATYGKSEGDIQNACVKQGS